jgi:hypothetical protein
MRRELAGLALALAAGTALGQLLPSDPDWREAEAPAPPALRTQGLIPLEMPRSLLRYGVDPVSVSVGEDRIVRYVVVAISDSGFVNAFYEGIRCSTGEFKTYARHNPDTGWVRMQADWRALNDGALASRHSIEIARGGACIGRGAALSASEVVRNLRAGPEVRDRPEYR